MADDSLVNLTDQFQGLPMAELIGGPLIASARAEQMLARGTLDFINSVGFDWSKNGDAWTNKTKYVNFEFERHNQDATGREVTETVSLKVPMLALVRVPSLQVDSVDVTFDMEVKSSTSHKSSLEATIDTDTKGDVGALWWKVDVDVKGKVTTHEENTRSSDNSAKYHVAVHASSHGMPEGLARMLDIMASSIAPVVKSTTAVAQTTS